MSEIPPGSQVSEDGHWWWDGSQWQPVAGQSGSGPAHGMGDAPNQTPAGGEQLSEDGRWWWDGSVWQPVPGQSEPEQSPGAGDIPNDIAVSMQDEVVLADEQITLSELEPMPSNAAIA